jgi:hypothetical protein
MTGSSDKHRFRLSASRLALLIVQMITASVGVITTCRLERIHAKRQLHMMCPAPAVRDPPATI